jgi:hypothetical protein
VVFLVVAEFYGVDIPPFVLILDRFSNNELLSELFTHKKLNYLYVKIRVSSRYNHSVGFLNRYITSIIWRDLRQVAF